MLIPQEVGGNDTTLVSDTISNAGDTISKAISWRRSLAQVCLAHLTKEMLAKCGFGFAIVNLMVLISSLFCSHITFTDILVNNHR